MELESQDDQSVEQSIPDTGQPKARLREDFSCWELTVFAMLAVVGGGIFTTTASIVANIAGLAIELIAVVYVAMRV